MSKRCVFILCFQLALLIAWHSNANCWSSDSVKTKNEFKISPYFWFIGYEGTLYTPPVPSHLPELEPTFEIDVGFQDIKNSIKWAMMLNGDFETGKLIFNYNFASLVLKGEAVTPHEIIIQNFVYRLVYNSGNFSGGYQFVKNDQLEIAALIGLKFIDFKLEMGTDIFGVYHVEGSHRTTWIDPLIATRIQYHPIPKFEFTGYADVGGFIFGKELNFQWMLETNVYVTRKFFVSGGYRFWEIIAERPEERVYDGKLKGWLARIGFRF